MARILYDIFLFQRTTIFRNIGKTIDRHFDEFANLIHIWLAFAPNTPRAFLLVCDKYSHIWAIFCINKNYSNILRLATTWRIEHYFANISVLYFHFLWIFCLFASQRRLRQHNINNNIQNFIYREFCEMFILNSMHWHIWFSIAVKLRSNLLFSFSSKNVKKMENSLSSYLAILHCSRCDKTWYRVITSSPTGSEHICFTCTGIMQSTSVSKHVIGKLIWVFWLWLKSFQLLS